MNKEITVIGGAGHVGLAFALICAKKNFKIHLHDTNNKNLDLIKKGIMPHKEKGGALILKEALKKNLISFSNSLDHLKLNKINIICIGTPVDEFMNSKYNVIINHLNDLKKYIKKNNHLIIRSTIAPGTTDFIYNFFKKNGKKINVTFYPERFVQGRAIEEFNQYPQIIGPVNKTSEKETLKFLKQISNETIVLKPKEAELTKLFLNSYRYVQFSIANQFYKIADSERLDYSKINHAMSFKYKRGNIPTPGFTAGPCLLKDTLQLYSYAKNDFSLGINAVTTNEGIVEYIVNKLKIDYEVSKKTIGILGMAFKADIDDNRTSLSYKLKKILKMQAKKVLTTDPYVKNDKEILKLQQVIKGSDILILATPHLIYRKIKTKKTIIDIWNFFN